MSACEAKTLDEANKVLTIKLGEHFDFRSIHSFRQFCAERQQVDIDVVIDMASTRYMDSSGVALLLCLFQWIRAPHINVSAINCNPCIKQILEHSQCQGRINIH